MHTSGRGSQQQLARCAPHSPWLQGPASAASASAMQAREAAALQSRTQTWLLWLRTQQTLWQASASELCGCDLDSRGP